MSLYSSHFWGSRLFLDKLPRRLISHFVDTVIKCAPQAWLNLVQTPLNSSRSWPPICRLVSVYLQIIRWWTHNGPPSSRSTFDHTLLISRRFAAFARSSSLRAITDKLLIRFFSAFVRLSSFRAFADKHANWIAFIFGGPTECGSLPVWLSFLGYVPLNSSLCSLFSDLTPQGYRSIPLNGIRVKGRLGYE